MVDAVIRIFESTATSFETNGIGFLPDALSCVVTEERNGSFELEMVYPITGVRYSELVSRRILVTKSNPYADPQPFRIYEITKPINGKVSVYAEHISYDLSGIPLKPFTATNLQEALIGLKKNAMIDCPFIFSSDKSTVANYLVPLPTNIRSELGGVEGSILDTYRGEYEFDGHHVKLWNNRGLDRGATIRYAKNMIGLEQNENVSNLYTAVLPYWYSDMEEDGGLIQGGIIQCKGTYNFQKIFVLDCSYDFQNKPTVEQLNKFAESYIENNGVGVPKISVTVSFVNFPDSEEYQQLAALTTVHLCDTVTVEYVELGVKATGKCIKTKYNVLEDTYNSIEIGDAKPSLAATITANNDKLADDFKKGIITNMNMSSEEYNKKLNDTYDELTGGLVGLRKDMTDGDNKLQQNITDGDNKLQQNITDGDNKLAQDITDGDNKLAQDITDGDNKLAQDIIDGDNKLAQDIIDGDNKLAENIEAIEAENEKLKADMEKNDEQIKKAVEEADKQLADSIASTAASLTTLIENTAAEETTKRDEAITYATKTITGNLGGYVILHSSTGASYPDEILIMDNQDITKAKKVWRWNKSGLGYSSTGYDGTYGLAITQDGAIVADYIKSGSIDAALITAGFLNASIIRGGTLLLGGSDNGYGSLMIHDGAGNVIGTWTNNGIYAEGDLSLVKALNGKRHAAKMGAVTHLYNGLFEETEMGLSVDNLMFLTGTGLYGEKYVKVQPIYDVSKKNSMEYIDMILSSGPSGAEAAGTPGTFAYFALTHWNGTTGKTFLSYTAKYGVLDLPGRVEFQGTSGSGIYIYALPSTTGSPDAIFNIETEPNGRYYHLLRTANSSKRYKTNIRDMTDDDISKLYNIQPVYAEFKDGYLLESDERYHVPHPMFIAENVEEYFPKGVDHNEDGKPENWNIRIMIPAMFQMIKSQKRQIDDLNERIERLEQLIKMK